MEIRKNWRILTLLGLLSLIQAYKDLSSSITLFMLTILTTIVIAIVAYYAGYFFVREKPQKKRKAIGLKAALFVTAWNTLFSFIY